MLALIKVKVAPSPSLFADNNRARNSHEEGKKCQTCSFAVNNTNWNEIAGKEVDFRAAEKNNYTRSLFPVLVIPIYLTSDASLERTWQLF